MKIAENMRKDSKRRNALAKEEMVLLQFAKDGMNHDKKVNCQIKQEKKWKKKTRKKNKIILLISEEKTSYQDVIF